MKRLLVVFLVLLMAAAVYAEDRLSLSGSMRVEGYALDNFSDWDDDDNSDKKSFWDQRFRMGGKISVTEEVSVHFRIDLAETQWGTYTTRPTDAQELQVDRTYLQIKKDEMFTLKAGELYQGLGNLIVVDQNCTGVTFTANMNPLALTLAYAKWDEGDALSDEEELGSEDINIYAVNAGYKADNMGGNLFFAMQNDNSDYDASPMAVGLQGDMKMDNISINGELDFFSGDCSGCDIDYIGTQLWIDANMKLSDNANAGCELFYAMGTDDPREDQLTELTDFGSWVATDRGYMNTMLDAVNVFDFSGQDAGVIGGALYGEFWVMEPLGVYAHGMYLTPQEDEFCSLDSMMIVNLSARYKVAKNTTFDVQYNFTSPEGKDDYDPDAASAAMMRLQVKF